MVISISSVRNVATLLAMLISRKVTRSIVETSEAAHSLSRGQYEIPPHGCEYREMAELNGTLVYAAKELSQVENLQHELIANISHDLRTPLTMIGGYVEMMRDIPGEATPENMQVIIDETQRLSTSCWISAACRRARWRSIPRRTRSPRPCRRLPTA